MNNVQDFMKRRVSQDVSKINMVRICTVFEIRPPDLTVRVEPDVAGDRYLFVGFQKVRAQAQITPENGNVLGAT